MFNCTSIGESDTVYGCFWYCRVRWPVDRVLLILYESLLKNMSPWPRNGAAWCEDFELLQNEHNMPVKMKAMPRKLPFIFSKNTYVVLFASHHSMAGIHGSKPRWSWSTSYFTINGFKTGISSISLQTERRTQSIVLQLYCKVSRNINRTFCLLRRNGMDNFSSDGCECISIPDIYWNRHLITWKWLFGLVNTDFDCGRLYRQCFYIIAY